MSHSPLLPRLTSTLLVLIALLLPGRALAQTPAAAPVATGPSAEKTSTEPLLSSFSLFVENDVLPHLGDNNDQNYTGGFGFLLEGRFISALKLSAPVEFLDRLVLSRLMPDGASTPYSFLLYGTGFTPDDLKNPDVIPDDRPYGSIVGISVRKQTVEAAEQNSAWSTELAVGVLGLGAAEEIQSRLHAYLRKKDNSLTPYNPEGWSHQISDGGELTGLYRVSYDRLLRGHGSDVVHKTWQIVGGAEAMAGYYTNVAMGVSGRLGNFHSHFWEFRPGAMSIAAEAATKTEIPRTELFLFGGVRGRLVGYNALLQGQFKDSDHTVTPERLIYETDLGIAALLRFGKVNLQGVWNMGAGRSPEFKSPLARRHTWGSLMFSANWRQK